MRFSSTLETPLVTRINVTPIIDVALVMVIILLVTAPILAMVDLGIKLPLARTRGLEDDLNLCVTLGKSGELAIGEQIVSAAAFEQTLQARLAESPKRDILVIVRADAGTPHAAVRRVLENVKSAGGKRIGIATQQKTEDRR